VQKNARGYYYNPALQGVVKLLEEIKARPRVTHLQVKKGDFTLSLASNAAAAPSHATAQTASAKQPAPGVLIENTAI
jgi:hypothetical protein